MYKYFPCNRIFGIFSFTQDNRAIAEEYFQFFLFSTQIITFIEKLKGKQIEQGQDLNGRNLNGQAGRWGAGRESPGKDL